MASPPFIPRPLHLDLTPVEVVQLLSALPGLVWLDTAGNCPGADTDGGISLITASPRRVLTGNLSQPRDLEDALAGLQSESPATADWGFPLAGLFGTVDYDGSYTFGVYEEVLIFRHATGEWIATGGQLPAFLEKARDAPDVPDVPALTLPFQPCSTQSDYENMVQRAQEFISAGDIYQVNLAHRFCAPWPSGACPLSLALRLRAASPAPYAAFLDLGGRRVLSSSPESFLKMSGSHIRSRPIKGTRPRFHDPAADERSAIELVRSGKERAELLMITDLLRNDLGKVCEYGSVRVTDLLKLEQYEQVFHLVSTIEGRLRPDVSHIAALAACHPGGSITGAPKKRATEIIASLEPAPRGLYTGAIGYFGINGESQFSIAIRTIVIEENSAHFHVGAGIVTDSIPSREWEETLHKAAGLLAASSESTASRSPKRSIVPDYK